MSWKTGCWPIAAALILTVTRVGFAEITSEQVENAIVRGIRYLKSQQRANGSWNDIHTGYVGGTTSLCTLALLNAGEDVKSPEIQRALGYLRSLDRPEKVYCAALQTMVFCVAEPERDAPLIRLNVDYLESIQLKTGRAGAWAYDGGGDGDNSNTQFALLALHEAERVGIEVNPQVWRRALDHWLGDQRRDGSWPYVEREPAKGSMTCAGIVSVIICSGRVHPGDAQVINGRVQCCCEQTDNDAVQLGLQWLGNNFSVARHPGPVALGRHYLYYYLYALERVGRLTGRRFIGRHDWYREGAEMLVGQQDGLRGLWVGSGTETNELVATSFALLFLSKGRRPVVVGKLKYGETNEWDLHRGAIGNLTQRLEQRWRRDLIWQTIDVRVATVEDLLEAPVLFISGQNSFRPTREQKDNLRRYVNQGGFIFAEACCGGEGFDRDFRSLLKELFPDSTLRLLPPEHPVWYAEEKVNPKYLRPLYGIEACCRTSVVYCPRDLSCFWELSPGRRATDYPPTVKEEIESCLRTGVNVLTYATSRELKNKLDRPQVRRKTGGDLPERGVLFIPKLLHSGGGDDAPNALPNLLEFVRAETQMRINVENRLLSATDDDIYEYPIIFMHGRRSFRLSPAERKALATYVDRGGVIFADAICASPEFARAFRREMEAIFPGETMNRIQTDHPLFSREFRGFDLATVNLRDPQIRTEEDPLETRITRITPLLESLERDNRLAVIFSPYDISCAMENSASLECKGYTKQDAARLALNVILFALQQ